MKEDDYYGAAGAYDLLTEAPAEARRYVLRDFAPRLDPAAGPILDIGCGSGRDLEYLLDAFPGAELIGWEPRDSLRSLALGRLSAQPRWRHRVTVRPEGALAAPLPAQLGGVIMRGVLGHFRPEQRKVLWERLADHTPDGGVVLFDLPSPEQPVEVVPHIFADVRLGTLRYLGIAEGVPLSDETMRWTVTCQTLDGDKLLEEQTTDRTVHHQSEGTARAELHDAGFALERLVDAASWVATRVG